ncbi:hypothetical protein GCM10025791_24880 [Halioxenophilus aromaticivorans]|uniref:Uncharacterized protein n=1 Tax=Halioxenophilus aromaticivorans TaxID=1306992 RepID=A0AAV3U3Q4_9ALTE
MREAALSLAGLAVFVPVWAAPSVGKPTQHIATAKDKGLNRYLAIAALVNACLEDDNTERAVTGVGRRDCFISTLRTGEDACVGFKLIVEGTTGGKLFITLPAN